MEELLDPNAIIVRRPERQRRNVARDEDLEKSISSHGQINAIVVRREGGEIVLVAGERRLDACRNLGLPVRAKFFENLDPLSARIIELEENILRKELDWRDHVCAVQTIHRLYKEADQNWSQQKTCNSLNITLQWFNIVLRVAESLDSKKLETATGIHHAWSLLQRFAGRKTEEIVNEIIAGVAGTFDEEEREATNAAENGHSVEGTTKVPLQPNFESIKPTKLKEPSSPPIICCDFIKWASTYSGPKFNLVHCDFPYGVEIAGTGVVESFTSEDVYENTPEIYRNLLGALLTNLDRLMSYNAHMIFWFSMKYYCETVQALRQAGLEVQPHPFIWDRSPTGTSPEPLKYPKRTYDTALIAIRGGRKLVKHGLLSNSAPQPSPLMHPSQKAESMYRALLAMFVDETTTVLDPTCGYGGAVRVADELGAKRVLGIELDPNHVKRALDATMRARILRKSVR